MVITVCVWNARISVQIDGADRIFWFDDWVMITDSNLIRPEDKVFIHNWTDTKTDNIWPGEYKNE